MEMKTEMPALNLPIVTVTTILIASLYLLITEKIPVDKTALGIMVALAFTGILTPAEVISGFANPAVITVGAMFLLSHGLIRTGAVGVVSEQIIRFSKGSRARGGLFVLLCVMLASAFINNTPVVVLFIPIVMALSCECDFSPSKLLIPMSYASILAGTCTLIGTSTNIIVSDLSAQFGFAPLSMFELGRVGIPIAIIGVIYLYFLSPKLLPGRTAPVCELDDEKVDKYIAELIVTSESPLIGEANVIHYSRDRLGLDLIEVFRNGRIIDPLRTPISMASGDILLVKGSAKDILACLKQNILELARGEEEMTFGEGGQDDLIVELVIPPMSQLLQEPLSSIELQNDPEIKIIAIRTRRHHYSYRKIKRGQCLLCHPHRISDQPIGLWARALPFLGLHQARSSVEHPGHRPIEPSHSPVLAILNPFSFGNVN